MLFCLFALLSFFPLSVEGNILNGRPPIGDCHFVVVTQPKSGTYLLHKYLKFVQGKQKENITLALNLPSWNYFEPKQATNLDEKILSLKNLNTYLTSHGDLAAPILRFLKSSPDSRLIVNIRDLRDVLVSQVYFEANKIERYIGPTSFEEKLWFLLKHDHVNSKGLLHTLQHAKAIIPLIQHPNCFVVRYEDLVGSEGGGNNDLRQALIYSIAEHIQVPLTPERATAIASTLYGNKGTKSATYRSGKIGAWKEAFTKEQLKFFNEKFGETQLQLGYSLD